MSSEQPTAPAIEAEVLGGVPAPRRDVHVARYEPAPTVVANSDVHVGASIIPVTEEQAAILREDIDDKDLEIKPTGEVYASQVRFRNILNRAFKPMGWAILPVSQPVRQESQQTVAQEWALYVGGRFVSRAWGSADYHPSNDRMDWSDALEATKSNALTRCCKDLGIAEKCWDRKFVDSWVEKNAVKVWVEGKPRPFWRHKDARPYPKETRLADDSPNRPDAPPKPSAAPPRAKPQAPVPEPPPAPEDASQEAPEGTFVVQAIRSTEGNKPDPKDPKKLGPKWTRWSIETMADGGEVVVFYTFDKAHADTAQALLDSETPCTIVWEKTGHGQKIMQIVAADVGF